MKHPVRILITAGPTREPLDPVRFLSNASTGAQGVALARAALDRGWSVDLVHGPMEIAPPAEATAHAVTTTAEMLEACVGLHSRVDVVVGAAAVCDFRPRAVHAEKRRRGRSNWVLELVPTEDILKTLGRAKGDKLHAGFALETGALIPGAARKLREKNLDWIVANSPDAIGASASEYVLLGADGTECHLGMLSKSDLAERLLDRIASRLR